MIGARVEHLALKGWTEVKPMMACALWFWEEPFYFYVNHRLYVMTSPTSFEFTEPQNLTRWN